MTHVYTLRDVHQEYRPGVPTLDGIDLTISAGEHVAIVGANGSGSALKPRISNCARKSCSRARMTRKPRFSSTTWVP